MIDPQDPANHVIWGKPPATWVKEICDHLKVKPPRCLFTDERYESGQPFIRADLAVRYPPLGKYCTILVHQLGETKDFAKQAVSVSMLNSMGLTKENLLSFSQTKILPAPGMHSPTVRMHYRVRNAPHTFREVDEHGLRVYKIDPEVKEAKVEAPELKPKLENPEVKPKLENPEVKPKLENPELKPKMENPENPELKPKAENPEHTPVSTPPADNPIGNLTSYCLRNNLNRPVFQVESQTGPAQCPTYTVKCTVDAVGLPNPYVHELTESIGLKKIKRKLAQLILDAINENPPPVEFLQKAQENAEETKTVAVAETLAEMKINTKKKKDNAAASGGPGPSRTFAVYGKSNLMTLAKAAAASAVSPSTSTAAAASAVSPSTSTAAAASAEAPSTSKAKNSSQEICKLKSGDRSSGGCLCDSCMNAARALIGEVGGAEAILEEFCNEKISEGIYTCMDYKIDIREDQTVVSNLTIRVGSILYVFQGVGKTPKLAKDMASKAALKVISDGLWL